MIFYDTNSDFLFTVVPLPLSYRRSRPSAKCRYNYLLYFYQRYYHSVHISKQRPLRLCTLLTRVCRQPVWLRRCRAKNNRSRHFLLLLLLL